MKTCDACKIPDHFASECHALGKHLLLTKYIRNADEKKLQQAMDNYVATIRPPRMKRSQLKATIRTLLDNNQVDDIIALIPKTEYSDDDEVPKGKEQPSGSLSMMKNDHYPGSKATLPWNPIQRQIGMYKI